MGSLIGQAFVVEFMQYLQDEISGLNESAPLETLRKLLGSFDHVLPIGGLFL